MNSLCIPTNVNDTICQLFKTSNKDFIKFTEVTIQSIQRCDYKDINLQAFANKLSLSLEETEDVFGTLLKIIKWCQQLRSHSEKEIRNDLIEQGFSGETANNIVALIINKLNKGNVYYNFGVHIAKSNWRIDISFQNAMKRRSPTIIWEITLSNERQIVIEISMKDFQQMRFYITYLLNCVRRA